MVLPEMVIAETRSEAWPDVNLYHKVDDTFRLHAMATFVGGGTLPIATDNWGRILTWGLRPF
jgi:hypothetical protein